MKVIVSTLVFSLFFASACLRAQSQGEASAKAQKEFVAAQQESMTKAAALYPEASVQGSALNTAIAERAAQLRTRLPAFFRNKNWPLLLTQQAAARLGIPPKIVPPAPVPAQPAPTTAPPGPTPAAAPAEPTPAAPQVLPVQFEPPMASARTDSSGVRNTGSALAGQAMHESSVRVEYQFPHGLTGVAEVQCFFLGRNDTTMQHFIYSSLSAPAHSHDELTFISPELLGTTTTTKTYPVGTLTVTSSAGTQSSRTITQTDTTRKKGSTPQGWVVRFVSGGNVLKVLSNQPSLADMAIKSAGVFDQAIKDADEAAKSAPAK